MTLILLITNVIHRGGARAVQVWLVLGLLGLAGLEAGAGVVGLRTFPIGGRDYVWLDQYAGSNRLSVATIRPGVIRISGTGIQGDLESEASRIRVGGVAVWLSFPVRSLQGRLAISLLDLKTTLDPILLPTRSTVGSRVKKICIDAGHGGDDPGKRDGSRSEKTYTLLLAAELSKQLRAAGYEVVMTRSKDRAVDRDERIRVAQRAGADLFLSLHFNGADGPNGRSAQGVEVYCLTPRSAASTNSGGVGATSTAYPGNAHDSRNVLLAFELQRRLVRELGADDRGVRRARFEVLRDATMPAVLVEAGFMSNKEEAAKIYDSRYRARIASAIRDGVQSYRARLKPPAKPPSHSPSSPLKKQGNRS